MAMTDELRRLPADLPVPKDDGAAAHLFQKPLPDVGLSGSNGDTVNLGAVGGLVVLYCFPMMARGPAELPSAWNTVAGARGCTVQSLKYSDELTTLSCDGTRVYGVSLEAPARQREAVKRLGLRHVLLSDADRILTDALQLPTFELETRRYLRRVTLGARDGRIERVWYPVFPPGDEIADVVLWLDSVKGSVAEDRGSVADGEVDGVL
jgi:peroxiredoxin